jgi:hypothetical protein
MSRRETFYECVFLLRGKHCRLVVRAWDVEGAREEVATELQSAGLPPPAQLMVRPLARPSPGSPAFDTGTHAPTA